MQEQYSARPPVVCMETKEARPLLVAEYGNVCFRCGVTPSSTDPVLSVDHIIPIARGGYDTYPNYQLLCGSCNSWKGTRVIDFRPGSQSLDLTEERDVIPLQERSRKTWQPKPVISGDTEWVSAREAAIRLGVSAQTIRRMIRDGVLEAKSFERPGGTYYRVEVGVVQEQNERIRPEANQSRTLDILDALLRANAATMERQADDIATHRERAARAEERAIAADRRADQAEREREAARAELAAERAKSWWAKLWGR